LFEYNKLAFASNSPATRVLQQLHQVDFEPFGGIA